MCWCQRGWVAPCCWSAILCWGQGPEERGSPRCHRRVHPRYGLCTEVCWKRTMRESDDLTKKRSHKTDKMRTHAILAATCFHQFEACRHQQRRREGQGTLAGGRQRLRWCRNFGSPSSEYPSPFGDPLRYEILVCSVELRALFRSLLLKNCGRIRWFHKTEPREAFNSGKWETKNLFGVPLLKC